MNPNRPFAVRTLFTAAFAPWLAALVACGGSPSTASSAPPGDDGPVASDGSTSEGGAVIVVGSTGNSADAATGIPIDAGMASIVDAAPDGMAESAPPEPLDSGTPPVIDASADAPIEAAATACPGAEVLCSGGCVDPSSSNGNCGACGNACSNGETCQGGACACPSGETTCGGHCVAESDDPDHCGACGHGCLGGACSGGLCQPIVLTTASTEQATSITVDANNVYFATQFGLYACAKSGCASPTLLTAMGAETVLFEPQYGYLFASRWSSKYLDEDTLSGSSNYTASLAYPDGLTMDTRSVYVGVWGGIVAAYKGPQAFDSPRTIVDGLSDGVLALAVDAAGEFVYGVDTGTETIIRAATTSAGAYETFVTNQEGPVSIAVGGGNVFWTNLGTDANDLQDGAAYMCAAGASCPSPIPLGGGSYCTSVIVDDSRVYFDCNYTLYGCPLAGCGDGPTALASTGVAKDGAATLASDATAIYWMSTDGTGLKKVAK
jgi:hypothetical protein